MNRVFHIALDSKCTGLALFLLVGLAAVGVPGLARAGDGPTGDASRIYLSFEPQQQVSARSEIPFRTPFVFYVVAEGVGRMAAWEAKLVLPPGVIVLERRLAHEEGFNVSPDSDEWVVGVGGCLPETTGPVLLATIEAMVVEPLPPGAEIALAAPRRASLAGTPAWADCSSERIRLMPFAMSESSIRLVDSDGQPNLSATGNRSILLGNTPNPFNPSTRILFRMGVTGDARVRILDLAGRAVRTVELRDLSAGEHELIWDGRDDAGERVASGAYVVRLETPDGTDVRRVALLK